jgi:hypothetical protein
LYNSAPLGRPSSRSILLLRHSRFPIIIPNLSIQIHFSDPRLPRRVAQQAPGMTKRLRLDSIGATTITLPIRPIVVAPIRNFINTISPTSEGGGRGRLRILIGISFRRPQLEQSKKTQGTDFGPAFSNL